MSETMKAAVETPETLNVVTTDVVEAKGAELTDAELENVAGGLLDNLRAEGDVAAHIVGETIHTFVADTAGDREKTWPFEFDPQLSYNSNRMKAAVTMANREVARRIGEDAELRGMGATMVGALVDGDRAVIS